MYIWTLGVVLEMFYVPEHSCTFHVMKKCYSRMRVLGSSAEKLGNGELKTSGIRHVMKYWNFEILNFLSWSNPNHLITTWSTGLVTWLTGCVRGYSLSLVINKVKVLIFHNFRFSLSNLKISEIFFKKNVTWYIRWVSRKC